MSGLLLGHFPETASKLGTQEQNKELAWGAGGRKTSAPGGTMAVVCSGSCSKSVQGETWSCAHHWVVVLMKVMLWMQYQCCGQKGDAGQDADKKGK